MTDLNWNSQSPARSRAGRLPWAAVAACLLTALALIAAALASRGFVSSAVGLILVVNVAAIAVGKHVVGRWDSAVVVFLCFHMVYGVSAPVALQLGARLSPIFTAPILVSDVLVLYALATAGTILALGVAAVISLVPSPARGRTWFANVSPWLAVLVAAATGLAELINLSRLGGISAVYGGKAEYQSAATALSFTAPTELLAIVAAALGGIVFTNRSPDRPPLRMALFCYAVSLLPVIALWAVLGRRGPLVTLVLVTLMAHRWHLPVQRIGWKLGTSIVVLYLALAALHVNRSVLGHVVATGDFALLWERLSDAGRLNDALNPAVNEFGAPVGNVSEYLSRTIPEKRWGSTYLAGLLIPIPSAIYPGAKPEQISFEFRDTYFPQEARYGAIAGTGFSSILEAFINFGYAGPLLVYIALTLLYLVVDRIRNRSRRFGRTLLVLTLIPSAVLIHRSAFGDAIVAPAVLCAILVAGVMTTNWVSRGLRQ